MHPRGHVLYIANVNLLIISDTENSTALVDTLNRSRSAPSLKSSLVYIESRPGRLRCIAVGGQPPPALTVQLLPPVSSGLPVKRLELAESWWVTVGGRRGLRVVRRVTERGTDMFTTTTHDDGAEVRCDAVVTGLPTRTTTVKVVVHCTLPLKFFHSLGRPTVSGFHLTRFRSLFSLRKVHNLFYYLRQRRR